MPTMFDSDARTQLIARLRTIEPNRPGLWGKMSAPQMVSHLTDQMRHTMGDSVCRPVPSLMRNALARHIVIYWLPWPKGRVHGPPDAFITIPDEWNSDLAALIALVERFGASQPEAPWPNHAIFGPMTGRDWGYFCYKHFDHHIRQFGR